MKKILITGGAGFIGSHLVKKFASEGFKVTVLDKLTYCGNLENLSGIDCQFIKGDIQDQELVRQIYSEGQFDLIYHLAAESHVDRSISGPAEFLQTNIMGTFNLLHEALKYYGTLSGPKKDEFRFIHVSTDEVFGELTHEGFFTEATPYKPKSPYSASKASSDHLARAWYATYKLPTIVTNCSNNYGPNQFPEKLIPLSLLNAIDGKPIGIYGKGENIRDWIHVEDHCQGLFMVATKGTVGETYLFGGNAERTNNQVIEDLCSILDELKPDKRHWDLVHYIEDRKGHDFRYAIDDTLTLEKLGNYRKYDFKTGLKQTIEWYIDNPAWVSNLQKKKQESQS